MTNYRETLYSKYYSNQICATVADEVWTRKVFSEEILSHLSGFEAKSIGELGCGHGNLLSFLRKKGFQQVQGCDLSLEQVELAQKKGLNVVQQDAFSFLDRQENWDAIVAIDVMEHLTKDEAVLLILKFKMKLRQGGKVVIRIPNADAAVGGSFLWSDFTHELFLNAASAVQLFQSCGFSDIQVLGSYSKARGWKQLFSIPLRVLIELKIRLTHLAYGVGSSGKIWTPNLIIVAQKTQ